MTQYTNPSQVSRNLLPLTTIAQCACLKHIPIQIKEPLGVTRVFVERDERGRAMHAGKVICLQSSLVKH